MTTRTSKTAIHRLLVLACVGSVLAVSGCSSAPSSPAATPKAVATTPAPKLIWSDEFNGAANVLPDAKKWSFETGGSGWGNKELECYTNAPGNVSQDGSGHLVITAIRQPGHICSDGARNDYTSARITTQNKFTTKYGRLEIRAQVPTQPGTWPAFWALGSDITKVGWPQAGEIDVMEVVGKAPTTVHGTLHGPTANNTPYQSTTTTDVANLGTGFHTFAADWTPSKISFSVDGRTYGTITKTAFTTKAKWVYDSSFYLLLNLAVGGNFPGPPTPATTWPQKYTIDYVRVYN